MLKVLWRKCITQAQINIICVTSLLFYIPLPTSSSIYAVVHKIVEVYILTVRRADLTEICNFCIALIMSKWENQLEIAQISLNVCSNDLVKYILTVEYITLELFIQWLKYRTAKPLLYTVYRTRNRKQLGRK